MRNNNSKHPEITDLAEHFETLYQPMVENEMEKMYELRSNVYIPVNDDVIVMGELKSAALARYEKRWLGLLITCPKTSYEMYTQHSSIVNELVILLCVSTKAYSLDIACNT